MKKQPVLIRRIKKIARSDVGTYRNLFDSVQRLLDAGLLTEEDIQNSYFTWSSGKNIQKLGSCYTIFRIIIISSIYDDPSVPEVFLDHTVYHECVHMRIGYHPWNKVYHDAEFHRQMDLFPDNEKVDKDGMKFIDEYLIK